MNTETNNVRRGVLRAAALASLILLPVATVAAPQPCGCEKRQGLSWPEHLSYWSNMVEDVRNVNLRYTELEKLHADAETDWAAVADALEGTEALKDRMARLKQEGSALKGKFQSFRDDPAALVGLGKAFGELREARAEATSDLQSFYGANGGWETSLRKAEKAREDFVKTAKRFLSAYQKAENLRYGSGGNIDCVIRLFDDAERQKEDADTWAADLTSGQNDAADNRQKLLSRKSDIESAFADLDDYMRMIAETFGLPSTATPEQIEAEIANRTVERVTVRFGNVKRAIEPQTLRKGIDKPEKVEPDGDANGPGFLGWRERANERDFDDWDKPLSDNLVLDAKWGYRIYVAGEPMEFPSSDWNDRYTLAAVFTDERVQAKRDDLAKQAPKGKVLDGWATSESPEEPLAVLTANAINGMRLVPHYADVKYTLSFVVPEGKAPPPQTLGWKELPRVPDLTKLESANGFRYVRWSLKQGGSESWNGGEPLTEDLTVFAVPEADYNLRFHDENGVFLATIPVRAAESFALARAPQPPARKGLVFAGWKDGKGKAFAGGAVAEDMKLYAEYREESASEFVRRMYKPLEDRFPLESLAGADVGLLLLLGGLAVAGRKPRAKKAKKGKEGDAAAAAETKPDAKADGEAAGA